jgi:galactose mutarotase-like enzyme
LDWLSEYRGGWQALFPNAGDTCTVDAIPHPFHGEWSRTAVAVVDEGPTSATVTSGVRSPMTMRRHFQVDTAANTLLVTSQVTNTGTTPTTFVLGEHPALALPAGARIFAPAGPVHVDSRPGGSLADLQPGGEGAWPMAPRANGEQQDISTIPQEPSERLCYLPALREPWAVAAWDDRAVALVWDRDAFPHMWFWQQRGGAGFPWFGRADITALEPAMHWPANDGLAGAIARGQARTLVPGGTWTSWLRVRISIWSGEVPESVSADGKIHYEGGTR